MRYICFILFSVKRVICEILDFSEYIYFIRKHFLKKTSVLLKKSQLSQ